MTSIYYFYIALWLLCFLESIDRVVRTFSLSRAAREGLCNVYEGVKMLISTSGIFQTCFWAVLAQSSFCFWMCFTNTSFTSSHSFSISLSLSRTKESSHPIRRGRSTVLIKSGRSLAVRERVMVIRSLYIHLGQNFSGRLQIRTEPDPDRSREPARERIKIQHGDVDTHTPPGGIAYVHYTIFWEISSLDILKKMVCHVPV